MLFTVEVLLNRREDLEFFTYGYREGDPVESIGTFAVLADDAVAAAEVLFELGNLRDRPDSAGTPYPADERSLSKGDVLVITGGDGEPETLACSSVGWKTVRSPLVTV